MIPATPRLPFSSPAWLSPRRVVLAAVVVFAVAAALPAVWWISEPRHEIGHHPSARMAMAATTALLSMILVRLALRAGSFGRAAAWCLGGGVLAGILNAGLSLAAVTLVRTGNPGGALIGMFLGALFGGLYGAPLGLLFGAAYLGLVRSAYSARIHPSHDGGDRVLLAAGVWLALGGAALLVLSPSSPAVVPPAALVALGAAAAGLAGARRRGRRRWLARVAAGVVPGWQIAARSGQAHEKKLLPVTRGEEVPLDGVLLRVPPPGDPYRHAPADVPAALVPLPLPSANPPPASLQVS